MTEILACERSIDDLYNWVKRENYLGWDPYDALNSKIVQKITFNNPYLETIIIQINKYSMINFRHLLKIQKGVDLKGIALFAQAYSKLWKLTKKEDYIKDLKSFLYIIDNRSLRSRHTFDCWAGHYFPYTAIDKSTLDENTPELIATSQVINALVDSYKLLREDKLKQMAISAYDFLIQNLLERLEAGVCFFKYSLTENDKIVLNASAQGLEALCRLRSVYVTDDMNDLCEKLAKFLIKCQKEDGSWVYSMYNTGKVRNQLDFHQGYIIDGLLAYLQYAENKNCLIDAIIKGAKFYKNVLFHNNGTSYYRYPIRYPIDIHNQAQGIITFCKLSILDPSYLNFAKTIASWTISNMQDKSGYFYYQKWPFFINKIPYMRWSQAWMMLALSTLMEHLRDEY